MNLTQEQKYTILSELVSEENGLQQILQVSLESLMKSERELYREEYDDYSNGYRVRKTYGRGKMLELKIPRTRSGQFHPVILGLLRDQEEEARKIAFKLYGAGLTTEQVGDVFGDLYGHHYSTSQVSRMFDYAREEVEQWLNRPLESYYPIVYIDAVFISTRRVDSVSKEAYHTVLGVKDDLTREVLGVFNNPTESALFWSDILADFKSRGVREIGLFVSDGLSGIETSISKNFPSSEVQLCCIHLMRECQKYAKPAHKSEMAEYLKDVFQTNDSQDDQEQGFRRWKLFCNKWSKYYKSFSNKANNERYRLCFTYLGYDYRIRNMIYSTNWVERLNRDYKRTTKMRTSLPNPQATLLLLGSVAMTRKAYQYKITALRHEKNKFKWEE